MKFETGKMTRDAMFGATLAVFSLAHENAQAVEVPQGMSWDEGIPYILKEQERMGVEQATNILVLKDGGRRVEWRAPKTEDATKMSVTVTEEFDIDLIENIEEVESHGKEVKAVCLVHSHPPVKLRILGPPSFDDIKFFEGRSRRVQSKLENVEYFHMIVEESGIWYYHRPLGERGVELQDKVFSRYIAETNEKYGEEKRWIEEIVQKALSGASQEIIDKIAPIIASRLGRPLESIQQEEGRRSVLYEYFTEKYYWATPSFLRELFGENKNDREEYEEITKEMRSSALSLRDYHSPIGEHAFTSGVLLTMIDMSNKIEHGNSVDLQELYGWYERQSMEVRFVPQEFIRDEPPCAGVQYEAQYEYKDGKWTVKSE